VSTPTSSLGVRGFPPLAASYAVNELGDNLGVIALALLILDETGSALATTALFLIGKFLPALLAPALTAGLDRRPVGRVLPLLYAVEAAAFAGLALYADAFWLPAVLALAFVDGVLAITARGLSRGAIAAILTPAGRLREGNALINVLFAVTGVGGPLLAGLLVHQWGPGTALWADAASFVGAAVLLAACAGRLPVPAPGEREHWLARVRDGLAYLRSHPVAGRLLAGEAIAIVFFTMTVPIEVVYAEESLDSGAFGFGALVAAWGVGILIGSGAPGAALDGGGRRRLPGHGRGAGAGARAGGRRDRRRGQRRPMGLGDDGAAGGGRRRLPGARGRAAGVGGRRRARHRLPDRRRADLRAGRARRLRRGGGGRRGGRARLDAPSAGGRPGRGLRRRWATR
jgi:MFS family permease